MSAWSPTTPNKTTDSYPDGPDFKRMVRDLINGFKQAYPMLIALWGVFFVTFIVFPGVSDDNVFYFLKDLKAKDLEAWNGLVYVFIFNIFDTIGRYCGGVPKLKMPQKGVIIMSGCRLIFVMTFIMIDYGQRGWGPQWLFGPGADWFKIINMAIFAITNGFTST